MYWLGDTLARIRNALMVKKRSVEVMRTKQVVSVLKIMKQENYILDFEIKKYSCIVMLKYHNNESVIENFRLVSKPSCRIYVGYEELVDSIKNFRCPIISTSSGILSGKEAYMRKIGGEFLCEVI